MNDLIIKGRTSILGKAVPIIYGGFGDNQKTMLAKTVAELHSQPLHHRKTPRIAEERRRTPKS